MNKQEYLDRIKEAAKEGIRFYKKLEATLVDTAIEEGTLPDPKQLSVLDRNIFAVEVNKLGSQFSLRDLQDAWERAKSVIEETKRFENQISKMTLAEQEALLRQKIEMLPEELRKLWRTAESAPVESKTDNPKHELLNCNRWLIDQFFNQGNTNYRALCDEWLRIRREQDYREPPTDPIASMRTAIHEEKGRRA